MTSMLNQHAMPMSIEGHQRFRGPLDRLMYLRSRPGLLMLQAHELMSVAQHTHEQFFAKGSVLLEQGAPVSAVYFVVEGQLSARRDGVTYMRMGAGGAAGFLPLYSDNPTGCDIIADEDTLVLALGADELYQIMEENFAFMSVGLRLLTGQMADLQAELETRGLLSRSAPQSVPYPDAGLDIVERIRLFRRGPYRTVNLEPLAQLARHAEEVHLEPGEVLWREGEASLWGVHVVYGVVECVGRDRKFVMGPDSVVGYLEANAERPRRYSAIAQTKLVLLRGYSEVFFDVLEDHFELGKGVLAFLSEGLISLHMKIAMTNAASP